jgi:hypothetical protein
MLLAIPVHELLGKRRLSIGFREVILLESGH